MVAPFARSTFADECLIYWDEQDLVIRYHGVWLVLDPERTTVSLDYLPGTSLAHVLAALERAQRIVMHPERWPTREPAPISETN